MSRGVGCAWANRPGIYTLVKTYVDWISKIISDGQCEKSDDTKKSDDIKKSDHSQSANKASKTNTKTKHKSSPVRDEEKFDLEN